MWTKRLHRVYGDWIHTRLWFKALSDQWFYLSLGYLNLNFVLRPTGNIETLIFGCCGQKFFFRYVKQPFSSITKGFTLTVKVQQNKLFKIKFKRKTINSITKEKRKQRLYKNYTTDLNCNICTQKNTTLTLQSLPQLQQRILIKGLLQLTHAYTTAYQNTRCTQTYNDSTTLSNEYQTQRRTQKKTGSSIQDEMLRLRVTYIGETGRNLNTRITEQKRATKNDDLIILLNTIQKQNTVSSRMLLSV